MIVGFCNILWQNINLNSHKFMQEFAKRHRARHWIWGAFFSKDYESSILILNAKDVNEDWKSFQGYIYKWSTCVKLLFHHVVDLHLGPWNFPPFLILFQDWFAHLHIIADLWNQFCLKSVLLWKPIRVFCKLETHSNTFENN